MQTADSFAATTAGDPLLEMRHVSVHREGRALLDAVNLAIELGSHTALLGANGSGKSTLVKLIERRIYPLARDPAGGEVCLRLFGRERWRVEDLRRQLGVVSAEQQLALANDSAELTAFDVVVSGFFASHGLALDQHASAAQERQAHAALERMGAGHLAERRLRTLSTGEGRRVIIARALVHQPRALLLDEPCSGLDMVSRRRFLEQLRVLAQGGTTLLLVTHHVEEIIPEIEQVVLLREGRVQAAGPKQTLLDAPHLGELFGAPVALACDGSWYHARLG